MDVIVIGGTASGIAAGIAAANGVSARHTVHVFEQLPMIGGMAVAGGQGFTITGMTGPEGKRCCSPST